MAEDDRLVMLLGALSDLTPAQKLYTLEVIRRLVIRKLQAEELEVATKACEELLRRAVVQGSLPESPKVSKPVKRKKA